MAFPYLDNPATLSDTTVQELDGLVTKLNTFLRQQHTDDGSHTTITADSVIVDGPVTVRDAQQTPSTFARTTAKGTVIDITGRPDNTNPFLSIRYKFGTDPLGPVVRLGTVGTGSTGVWPGVRVGPSPAAGHTEWDMVSGQVTAGPAWMLVDATHSQRVLVAVNTAGRYEVRPETFGPEVWLGANVPGQRYARGYIDAVYEQGRAAAMGDWQDVPFNAGNFAGAAGMAWTVLAGNVAYQRFALVGQTLHYGLNLSGSSVGGVSGNQLLLQLPTGLLAAAPVVSTFLYRDAGGPLSVGLLFTGVSDNALHLAKLDTSNWTNPSAATDIFVNTTLEVTG